MDRRELLMAIDKGVDSGVLDGMFTDIANAIRGKNGETAQYTPSEMPAAIAGLPTGLTVTRGTVTGNGAVKSIYTGLTKITYFLIFPSALTSALSHSSKNGGRIYIYDGVGNIRCRVVTTATYNETYSSFIISGGTVQLGQDSSSYLISDISYTWIAMGS